MLRELDTEHISVLFSEAFFGMLAVHLFLRDMSWLLSASPILCLSAPYAGGKYFVSEARRIFPEMNAGPPPTSEHIHGEVTVPTHCRTESGTLIRIV